ncbi:MAG: CBS domain-containing protein [Kofleriaceae bacterium]
MRPLLVKDLMSAPVISLFSEARLPLAHDIMTFKHLRHLPVVDDSNHVVGLVSHRDILRAQISSLTGLTEQQVSARQEEVRIAQLMTRDVWTVTPETLASVAGRTLLDHKFGCLPVVEGGVLVGIVTERDFLRFAVKAIEQHD